MCIIKFHFLLVSSSVNKHFTFMHFTPLYIFYPFICLPWKKKKKTTTTKTRKKRWRNTPHDDEIYSMIHGVKPRTSELLFTKTYYLVSEIWKTIHCPLKNMTAGVKLDSKFREKWLLPPVEIGRSDSQEGRSGSAWLRHFSFNFKEK